VKKLTWAKEIAADGRPVKNPGQEPTEAGTTVCPAVEGATNWFSAAYHPGTGLHYVQALEKCNVFSKREEEWRAGHSYYGGATRRVEGDPGQKFLRALDVATGRVAWEHAQQGPADSWGGILATGGGLVFYGDDDGSFAALDAKTGAPLWRFPTQQLWKASPMTYSFDGRQYVAVASGPNIIVFGLME
jgi:alcohol dehydrogenase (cytochrome c)